MTIETERLRARVATELERTRERTALLTGSVDDDDLVRQHSRLMSPLVWDLAHVGNQEELWLLRDVGGRDPMLPETVDQLTALERHRVQQVQHLRPHGADVRARLGRAEQRQGRSVDAGVLERVVQLVDVLPHRLAAADVAHQPEFLLVADVRQVPHQR